MSTAVSARNHCVNHKLTWVINHAFAMVVLGLRGKGPL